MKQKHVPLTPYEADFYSVVAQMRYDGWIGATAEQIAEKMGRKVTPSLRRRLKQAEQAGHLWSYRHLTERGGLGKAYGFDSQFEVEQASQVAW